MHILTEGRKEFLAWAGGPDEPSKRLLDRFLDFRKKVSGKEADMDWWVKNKTPKDLEDFMSSYKSKSAKKREEMAGAYKLYDSNGWVVLHITTYDAMKHYGKGTKWCIAGNYPGHEERGNHYFNSYLENNYSAYYVFIDNNRKLQADSSGYVNNKWCVCIRQDDPSTCDIWNAPDYTIKYIDGNPPKVDGVPAVGQFTIIDGVLVGVAGAKNLESGSITIPESVTEIKPKLFLDSNVRNITLPNNLRTIGFGAFASSALRNIEIPDSVLNLGHKAFLWCKHLSEVSVGSGISKLEPLLFAYCDNLSCIGIDGVISEADPSFIEGSGDVDIYVAQFDRNSKLVELLKTLNNVKGIINLDTGERVYDKK